MKPIAFLFCLAVLTFSAGLHSESQDSTHVRWVAQSIKAMQTVKIGTTRADLEKVFATQGGLSTATMQTYVYRGCPYFKVDVEFEPNPANPGRENDKVTRISKPYLEWPTGD